VLLLAFGGTAYAWSDASGLLSTDSSFYINPAASDAVYLAISHSSGVVYRDTTHITIPVFSYHGNDTAVCMGDTVTLSASGGSSYTWSVSGATISASSTASIAPLTSLKVVLNASQSGCTFTDTTRIHVYDQIVWPGDINDDHSVDNNDYLYIGVAFGATGPPRPAASIVWTAQCADSWDSTFASGVNYAHADANGDGVIGYDDTLAVYNNWGDTHPKQGMPRTTGYPLSITTDKTQYRSSEVIHATIAIGQSSNPVPNLYGIAYQFEVMATGTITAVSQASSCIAPRLDVIRSGGPLVMYLAQSRIDHIDTLTYGMIGTIDIALDSTVTQPDSVYIVLSNATAINRRGDTIPLSAGSSVVAVSGPLGISTISQADRISMYPNPSASIVHVVLGGSATATEMAITDALGRQVYVQSLVEKINTIDLSKLPDGVYTVSFSSVSVQQVEQLLISK
jgi:hypothetical protein